MKRISVLSSIAFLLISAMFSIAPRAARAQGPPTTIYEVNTFVDLYDNANNDICAGWVGPGPGDFGPCSLRSAIFEAGFVNGLQPGFVHIKLPPGTYKLTLSAPPFVGAEDRHYGDLDLRDFPQGQIPNEVLIEGTGAPDNPSVIDARFIDRVLELGEYQNLTLRNLVIQNGSLTGTTIENSVGGGIYQHYGSTLILEHVLLENNHTTCSAYNCSATGAAIYSQGKDLFIYDSEFLGNNSDRASAIGFFYAPGTLLIENSSIHRNVSDTATIIGSGDLFLVNSTIAKNFETDTEHYQMGTIHWAGPAWIQNSTVITGHPKRNISVGETLTLRNSILMNADSPQPAGFINCSLNFDLGHPQITSMGGNIFSDQSCMPDPGKRDLVLSFDKAKLDILEDYGGFTPTMALLEGSPAIDRVLGTCTVTRLVSDTLKDQPLETDQRGKPRTGAFCDAGAFEGDGGSVPFFLPIIRK